jgi:hypothetical protein
VRRVARTFVIVASTLVVTAMYAGSAVAATPYCQSLREASHPDWMRGIPDDTSLAALSIPGTHNSLALHGGDLTQTQENHGDSADTLSAQLDAGIRAVDIRVRRYEDRFTIHHGPYYQHANFADVLRKAGSFLEEHPGETVLLRLKAECTGEVGSCSDEGSELDTPAIFDWYRDNDPNGKYLYGPSATGSAEMPTLGAARGKIVLTTLQEGRGGIDQGHGLSQFTTNTWGEYVQDDYSVPTIFDIDDKWDKVREHLDKTNNGDANAMYLNFSSGASVVAVPSTVACGRFGVRGVNDYALEHLSANTTRTGVVMMDYPGAHLIDAIISGNS